ncbi:hypothetical protein [Paenibacillus sp. FSL H7-0714]|uniref:hypothetical protein n=1 Tax=Paenibacillus sp. FSL H7-0714 TaxID=2954735 RepID=UPI0030F95702
MSEAHEEILNSGIYDKKRYDPSSHWKLNRLFEGGYTYDCFCPMCEKESVFIKKLMVSGKGVTYIPFISTIDTGDFICKSLTLNCTRNEKHIISYYFTIYKPSIHYLELTKVGQYPSMADLCNSDTKKYLNVLGKSKHHEFNKAIGLFAHGIGIGSIVYLRRIFENLIEEAHEQAVQNVEWDELKYSKLSMDKRISLLGAYLPTFVLENRVIYPILSKGIHDLSEEECREAFPAVKIAIELILDEKIKEQEELKKRSAARKSLEELHIRHK